MPESNLHWEQWPCHPVSDNSPAMIQTVHSFAEEYSLHSFVWEKYIEYKLLQSKKQKSEIVNNTFSWLDNTNVYVYNMSPLVRYANILVFISKEGKWQINKGQKLFKMLLKEPVWAVNREKEQNMERLKTEYERIEPPFIYTLYYKSSRHLLPMQYSTFPSVHG